jgi:hypothetical protein
MKLPLEIIELFRWHTGCTRKFCDAEWSVALNRRATFNNKGANMSYPNKNSTPVTWSHQQTLDDGHVVAVSDKSGIMKISFPGSFLTVMMYRDQFEGLGITNPHLLEYVKRTTAIRNSQDNKQVKKLDTAKQKLIQSIINNPALTDEQKQSMIKLVA